MMLVFIMMMGFLSDRFDIRKILVSFRGGVRSKYHHTPLIDSRYNGYKYWISAACN